ncbi:hypothetical protein NTA43_15975 [Pseudomonas aeruginosa]|uniref:hypothetical protein n=1 Tax=Pseudomonas aeruginosa TaxID=287 RepID=UPI0005BCCC96|nr:hypothetical protein [Pseudomonas aeruginosa]AZM80474.1 hypothetical protein EIP87_00085 [Pseudomonas aeruginosa]EKW9784227.1 hypothetical protein [Pseudomonas aeruginosa]KSN10852.1 hypothetical protein APA83_29125 [Pseudomonas aeruginosa]MBG7512595.1 hypothetical protein [Pseudomonas aeruginosa]MBH4002540.1 hypothetical protein [Pseudomonas aeruginosa]
MGEMKRYYSFFTSHPGDWRPCSKEHHDMVRASPQDWPGYEVRELAVIPEGHVVVSEGLLREARRHLGNWLELHECECEGGFHYCGREQVAKTHRELRSLLDEGKEDDRDEA